MYRKMMVLCDNYYHVMFFNDEKYPYLFPDEKIIGVWPASKEEYKSFKRTERDNMRSYRFTRRA